MILNDLNKHLTLEEIIELLKNKDVSELSNYKHEIRIKGEIIIININVISCYFDLYEVEAYYKDKVWILKAGDREFTEILKK